MFSLTSNFQYHIHLYHILSIYDYFHFPFLLSFTSIILFYCVPLYVHILSSLFICLPFFYLPLFLIIYYFFSILHSRLCLLIISFVFTFFLFCSLSLRNPLHRLYHFFFPFILFQSYLFLFFKSTLTQLLFILLFFFLFPFPFPSSYFLFSDPCDIS